MDYKQKYEQALEYMRTVYPTLNGAAKEDVEHYFPELKESEDKEIRKSIIGFLKTLASLKDGKTVSNEDFDSETLLEWATWLEKQGEQKPTWSEEDKKMIDTIIYDLERHGGKEDSCYSAEINWLKSLKEK